MQKILIALIGVVIIGIAVFSFIRFRNTPINSPTTTNPVQNQENTGQKSIVEEQVITLTTSGFSPKSLSVKPGTKVVFLNKSGKSASINSANHPDHLLYPPLNLGEVDNNQSVQLLFENTGTYAYHDHYNPTATGTITVE